MFIHIRKGIILTRWVAKKITTDDLNQLDVLQNRLARRIDDFFGWHAMGAPLAFSTALTVMSFASPMTVFWIETEH